jgi:hypothetical protein
VAAANAGVGATSPAPATCAEPGCSAPRWGVKRRGQWTVVSELCEAHANVPLFEPPPAKIGKPKSVKREHSDDKGAPLLSHFHSEVKRKRLEREATTND